LEKEVKGEAADEKAKYNWPIEGRERRSMRFVDSQRDPTLTVGPQVRTIGRWLTKGSAIDRKKALFKEIRQMESTVEAGQSTIGNGS
jgi:hypothetical protein